MKTAILVKPDGSTEVKENIANFINTFREFNDLKEVNSEWRKSISDSMDVYTKFNDSGEWQLIIIEKK